MSQPESARQKMEQALEALRRDFSTVRTGKASPGLLDTVKVEAYGSKMPLNQVATVGVPEARLLTVQPWDKGLLSDIERAIQTADLGLNPSNDGNLIRIPVPPLTEERRKEYVKVLHKMAEEARVSIRHARKEANTGVKESEKEGELSEDDARRQQEGIQKMTDEYVQKVDALLAAKEADVMEV